MNAETYVCSSCRMLYVPADDMSYLTRPHRLLLAALMIADGAWVLKARLGWVCQRDAPSLVWTLRKKGIAIESRRGGHIGGYRLTELPPDWCLERVLVTVHELRRHEPVRLARRAS